MTTSHWKEFLEHYGYYAVNYTLHAESQPGISDLRSWLSTDSPRFTGWPPFWVPTRDEIAPQVVDQWTLECTHDGTGATGHIERWRASTRGQFTLVRMHDIDGPNRSDTGKYMNVILPIWRIAEILFHAERMSERFHSPSIDFTVKFTGLRGRSLTTKDTPNRVPLRDGYTTHAPVYEKRLRFDSKGVKLTAADIVHALLKDLYELFQFRISPDFCEREIRKLTSSRF